MKICLKLQTKIVMLQGERFFAKKQWCDMTCIENRTKEAAAEYTQDKLPVYHRTHRLGCANEKLSLSRAVKSVAWAQRNTQEYCLQLQMPKAKQSQLHLNVQGANSSISTLVSNTESLEKPTCLQPEISY